MEANGKGDCNDDSSETVNRVPPTINFNSIVVDIYFHPQKDFIAAGQIEGDVTIHSLSIGETGNNEVMSFDHHKKACRSICFSTDGSQLFTAGKDKSLYAIDMDRGAVLHTSKPAHDAPVYSMLVIDNYLLATGDDDGTIKIWDFRRWAPIVEWKHSEEFISDMVIDANKKILLATSGEGTLTAYNVRSKQLVMQSELIDSELLSVAIVDGGRKIVCGSGEGVLNVFNWGEWGNICDRFPGHPESIDAICPIADNVICTGSMDGKIRAVHVVPNRFLGVVGEHDEFPVEQIRLSRDKTYIATCSHDQKIKFWNIENVKGEVIDAQSKPRAKKSKQRERSDFFDGLNEAAS